MFPTPLPLSRTDRKTYRQIFLSIACFAVFCWSPQSGSATANPNDASASVTAVVTININKVTGLVNRQVLGNNALGYLHGKPEYSAKGSGLWDPLLRAPAPGLLELARKAGVSSLRWPGGCAAHYFNWKQTVGPLETRPLQPFGLAEFIQVAKQLGAEPVITVADYWGTAQDAADLVEYLNAPVGLNVNGGIDWAAVRAKQGYPEPFEVKWFEFGNETDHGPHAINEPTNGTPMSASEYSRRFREYSTAMKAVNSTIRLGAILAMETSFPLSQWSDKVIKETGNIADFYIYHAYLPRYSENSNGGPAAAEVFNIAFGASDQLDVFLRRLSGEIKKMSGRDVPLGITEFNGQFVQDKPKPYRLSLGTAVLVADMALIFLKPTSGIAFANYWQFSNEYWGTVRGYGPSYLKRPAYYVFEMLNQNLGEQLVSTQVKTGGYQNKGGYQVLATSGVPSSFQMKNPEKIDTSWKTNPVIGVQASVDNANVLSVQLPSGLDINYHQSAFSVQVTRNLGYRITADIRVTGLEKSGARLEVTDGRGWNATKSTAFSRSVKSSEWTPVTVDYLALPDATSIDIRLRRPGGVAEGGRMEVRNVVVRSYIPDRQSVVPYVSATATKKDNKLSVFLVNRNVHQPVQVALEGLPLGAVDALSLSGPEVDSNNEEDADQVVPRPIVVTRKGTISSVVLPPHSFSVVRINATQ